MWMTIIRAAMAKMAIIREDGDICYDEDDGVGCHVDEGNANEDPIP